MGTHPKCVQTPIYLVSAYATYLVQGNGIEGQSPIMINHSGFLTRSSSFWGSRRASTLTLSASLISSAVRWRMKTGLPRHLTMTCANQYMGVAGRRRMRTFLPSGMEAKSTSTLAMAKTSADADMFTKKSMCRNISTAFPIDEVNAIRSSSPLSRPRVPPCYIRSFVASSIHCISEALFQTQNIIKRTLNGSLSTSSSQSTHRSNHNYYLEISIYASSTNHLRETYSTGTPNCCWIPVYSYNG